MKKRLEFKNRLRSRKKTLGTWNSLAHPQILEAFTNIGAHFAGIDIEHSTISQEQAQRLISTAQAGGMAALPRIASHNMEMIKRLLDSGADGIITPMVNNKDELNHLISYLKYPPVGKRSYGIGKAQNYGFDFSEYTSQWNDSSILIIQIETVEGVKNIESLLSEELVDAVMIGPYDLSGSLGVPGQLQHPKVTEACEKVKAIAEKYKKSFGTHIVDPDEETVKKAFEFGYNFVILGSDIFTLWKWSEKMKNISKKIID